MRYTLLILLLLSSSSRSDYVTAFIAMTCSPTLSYASYDLKLINHAYEGVDMNGVRETLKNDNLADRQGILECNLPGLKTKLHLKDGLVSIYINDSLYIENVPKDIVPHQYISFKSSSIDGKLEPLDFHNNYSGGAQIVFCYRESSQNLIRKYFEYPSSEVPFQMFDKYGLYKLYDDKSLIRGENVCEEI